ncbi:unnamed protein product [Parascedosporium putredinis]|uniref:Zn(2)-C6 fungal-type domain-containing protein n=1 Tax=Parascedosporium putredinis TaxID=1442378 RepID=A0A9P1M839_9PEZI|nr:unnamed protein product [Parascedosporium putredinis]CAI7991834.1 unnamed protein product [Parascedosporium putredinis]
MASPNPPDCLTCHLPLAPAPSRPNGCPFCGKEFRRVDGAKRHAKTCAARGDRPVPDAKRGRKVRACDACARIKVSCDAGSPCSRCASRGLRCVYGRFCTDPAHVARPDAGVKPIASLADDEKRPSMPFLLACTDPSVGPVDEIIITREPEQQSDDQPPQSMDTPVHLDTHAGTIDPRLLFTSFIGASFSMGPGYDGMDDDYLLDTPDRPDQLADDRLGAQVGLLEAELRRVVSKEPTLSQFRHVEPPAAFFTVSNFREYIKAFFQRDQLLATVIHQPTFHPDRVDLTLLLAIAVAGSAYLLYRRRRVDSGTFVSRCER